MRETLEIITPQYAPGANKACLPPSKTPGLAAELLLCPCSTKPRPWETVGQQGEELGCPKIAPWPPGPAQEGVFSAFVAAVLLTSPVSWERGSVPANRV